MVSPKVKFGPKINEFREKFSNLVEKSVNLSNGIHDIVVAKVLAVGRCWLNQPEVAIIKDNEGRVLLIPEDTKYDGHNRLYCRWNVKKGMFLQIVVEDNEISGVIILKGD